MEHLLYNKHGDFLLSIGEHILNSSSDLPLHTHHHLEISVVLKGTAVYLIGGDKYELKPNDVIILNNTEPHRLLIEGSDEFRHIVIHFDPSFIWNSATSDFDYNFLLIFFERSSSFSHRLDRENPATSAIVALIWEILHEMEQAQRCYELMTKIKLETIFATIIRHYDYVDTSSKTESLTDEYIQLFHEVRQYIDEHLSESIHVADLAKILHVSPTYFSMLFKRFNMVSPVEYIIHKRIQRAIELIRTTTMSITAISHACGFNNSTNFYKAFNRITGRTPAMYRNA